MRKKDRKKERGKLHKKKMKELLGEGYIVLRDRIIEDGTVGEIDG